MDNKQFGAIVFSITFGIACFIWAVLMGVMAKDLVGKVNTLENEKGRLEQEITELKWENENNYMYCEVK